MFSSNAVKAANPNLKMVGLAIGRDASPDNIAAVSGPTANDDYFLAANFVDLQNKLQQIATQLCGGTVTVKKEIPNGQGGWQPAQNWTFTPTSTGPAPTPASGATDVNGVVNFDLNNTTSVTATVTETLKAGYQLVQQGGNNAVCTKPAANPNDPPVSVPVTKPRTGLVHCGRDRHRELHLPEPAECWFGGDSEADVGCDRWSVHVWVDGPVELAGVLDDPGWGVPVGGDVRKLGGGFVYAVGDYAGYVVVEGDVCVHRQERWGCGLRFRSGRRRVRTCCARSPNTSWVRWRFRRRRWVRLVVRSRLG